MTAFVFFNKKANVSYQRAMDFRLQIWDAGWAVFKKHMIFGDLQYPEKDALNYQHYLDGKYYFLDSDLNTHNQYLSFLMRFGILGAILFSFYAFYITKLTLKTRDRKELKTFFGFAIILLMVCYIENILNRHHGIVFFTVFYNYYLVKLS